jgi:phosphatidyl-myo-inositol alpha-mannosyltransferase
MRIVMVCPYDLGRPGGVQGQATGLTRSLRKLGHDVLLLSPGSKTATADDASFGRVLGVHTNGSVAPVTLSPLAARRAWHRADQFRPDVVHLHEPLAPVLSYGFLMSHRIPMVGTFHRFGSSALYRVLSPVVRAGAGRLSARVAVSAAAAENSHDALGGDFEVLFNAIEVERFGGPRQSADPPRLLFVGRNEPRKGLEILLEAFSALRVPGVLWVASGGAGIAELQRRFPASDRLVWLGAVDDDEKISRLVRAQVLCAPSLGGESFGMVVLEGMAARCALVISDLDGYRAASGGHARLVPPGDVRALTDALEEALLDAAGASGLSAPDELEWGRSRAEQWSMEALADRYVSIYERVIGDVGSRSADQR